MPLRPSKEIHSINETEQLGKILEQAQAVIIGAGAGLSTAAGFTYSGERFRSYFKDFADKYHFKDMYAGGFYPYESLNEHWAYWSRYIYINRYMNPPKPLYQKLYELVKDKDYFVITTNVDHCFQKAGFDKKRLYYTQGDYGLFQCSEPCHEETYNNEDAVKEMIRAQGYQIGADGSLYLPAGITAKMSVPDELIPCCPKCGKPMNMNLRADNTFVQDKGWYQATERYELFLRQHQSANVLFLELGVGYNTPAIIKYPFWQMTYEWKNAMYACLNMGDAFAPEKIQERAICINDDIDATIHRLGTKNTTDLLLEELIADSKQYANTSIPFTGEFSTEEKKNAIRSLMNIRMPEELSEELLSLQDEYLQEELKSKGIVNLSEIPTIKEEFGNKSSLSDKISLWQGDITRLKVGAIVNAANSQMLGCFVPCHRCIDNAIHSAAGMQLRAECSHIMNRRRMQYGRKYEEPTGTATLTKGYNLPCDYVIHTVGPIVYGRLNDTLCQDLRNCYENVLKCCLENNIKSVAFCCISTGEFHFPNERAAEIALEAVTAFIEAHGDFMERIIFNVFKDSDREIYEKLVIKTNHCGFLS